MYKNIYLFYMNITYYLTLNCKMHNSCTVIISHTSFLQRLPVRGTIKTPFNQHSYKESGDCLNVFLLK